MEKFIYHTAMIIDDIGPLLYNLDWYIYNDLAYYKQNKKW